MDTRAGLRHLNKLQVLQARILNGWQDGYGSGHNFVCNLKNLPKHEYGKFNSSILEDEDLAQEIYLHLQLKGKYICAMDIVRFLETPEMKEWLDLKKLISERTAHSWMAKMGYRCKKEPKGQYKDGHEHEDVVTYQENDFLPFIRIHPTSNAPVDKRWHFGSH